MDQLPAPLRERLEAKAGQQHFRTIEAMLGTPPRQWQPVIPIENICEADIQKAAKVRDALKPWLIQERDPNMSAAERETLGVKEYRRFVGNEITPRYWRELMDRTARRDNGLEDWDRVAIYLPDRLHRKDSPAAVVSEALAEDFAALENLIAGCSNPQKPGQYECDGIWKLALVKFKELVNAGEPEKIAARRVRQFLFARASFLAASRDALWIAFKRKLAALKKANGNLKALRDGREDNGKGAEVSATDIVLLRHAAMAECGGRINEAWRVAYSRLSEATRARYPDPFKCPAKVYELVSRKKVDALHARHHGGKRAVRRLIGGLQRDWQSVPSMHSWALDDVTSNIEVAFKNRDGSTSLILPQIIAVMDIASRKWVGWSISDDKSPTAGLVCDAALNSFRKNNIPKELGVENGWVFGKSFLVNGKQDAAGRTIVNGLAQYGCSVYHFGKMNPQAKGELERSFEAIQRLMEKHPGYTGRHQMIDAPDSFRTEQRLIKAALDRDKNRGTNEGEELARKFRYTFEEFKNTVMPGLIAKYNSTPQFGHLNGLSPNEAFIALANPNDPPIEYDPMLEWMFSSEKTIVTVETGGVRFMHRSSGRKIHVAGGRLVNLVDQELWAFVDRKDPSMVTFMNMDFADPFTMEVCHAVHPRENSMAPGSGGVAKEISKLHEHERGVEDEYKRLIEGHGNPRRELLKQIRSQAAPEISKTLTDGVRRVAVIDGQLADSAEQMQDQRAAIVAEKTKRQRQRGHAERLAQRTGIVMPESAREIVPPEDTSELTKYLYGKESE